MSRNSAEVLPPLPRRGGEGGGEGVLSPTPATVTGAATSPPHPHPLPRDGGEGAGVSRRRFLERAALGVGGLAAAALHAPAAAPHHAAKAKRVIWLYMDGGISHLDTFDPKPELDRRHGQPFPLPIGATQFDSNGPCLKSPWGTKQRGQSGLWVSDLFPHLAGRADDLAVIRSMTNEGAVHASANYWMHTGWGTPGRPSAGAWVQYALGGEAADLPGFVVLNGGMIPTGGLDNFAPGFLPARHGPAVFAPTDPAVPDLLPADPAAQARRRRLARTLDRQFSERHGRPDPVEAALAAAELAGRMQAAVPDLLDLSREGKATQAAYGLDDPDEHCRTYARQCLLARRLVERGTRFVAVTVPRIDKDNRWDAHSNLKPNHEAHARAVDRPIAALLADLRARGLWDDVLVVFATEFGRTPFSQLGKGRDHNPHGFSVWLAGAGVRGGTAYGATDPFGYKAVEGRCQVHDLHATLLHLLGLDHEKLTYRSGGRDFRLTDVHGRVVREVLA